MDLCLYQRFNRFIFKKANFFQCVSSQKDLMEHREICLEIYGKQRVELKSGSIEVKKYFKQIAVPFEIDADIECNLEKNHIYIYNRDKNTSYNENIKIIFLVVLLAKLVCIDDKFSKPVFFYRGKNKIYKLIEAIREEYDY